MLHGPKVGFRPGGYDVRGNVDCEEEYELITADSTAALLSVKTIYTGWKATKCGKAFHIAAAWRKQRKTTWIIIPVFIPKRN